MTPAKTAEYTVPISPFGSEVVVICGDACDTTFKVNDFVPEFEFASVTLKPKVTDAAAVGVPEIVPLAGSKLKPV